MLPRRWQTFAKGKEKRKRKELNLGSLIKALEFLLRRQALRSEFPNRGKNTWLVNLGKAGIWRKNSGGPGSSEVVCMIRAFSESLRVFGDFYIWLLSL